MVVDRSLAAGGARVVAAFVPAGLVSRLHEREELVAHVEEDAGIDAAAHVELEHGLVELERVVDVADGQRDVIDTDEPGGGVALGHDRTVGPER